MGHTLSLAVAGILVIGLKVNVPEWLSERLELGVAAMLVLLGRTSSFERFGRFDRGRVQTFTGTITRTRP